MTKTVNAAFTARSSVAGGRKGVCGQSASTDLYKVVLELRLKALEAWKRKAYEEVEGVVTSRVNEWSTTILTAAVLYQESDPGTKPAVRKINERAVRDFWLSVKGVNKGAGKF